MIPEPARQPLDVDVKAVEGAAANGGVEAPGIGEGGASLDPDVLDAI